MRDSLRKKNGFYYILFSLRSYILFSPFLFLQRFSIDFTHRREIY